MGNVCISTPGLVLGCLFGSMRQRMHEASQILCSFKITSSSGPVGATFLRAKASRERWSDMTSQVRLPHAIGWGSDRGPTRARIPPLAKTVFPTCVFLLPAPACKKLNACRKKTLEHLNSNFDSRALFRRRLQKINASCGEFCAKNGVCFSGKS